MTFEECGALIAEYRNPSTTAQRKAAIRKMLNISE